MKRPTYRMNWQTNQPTDGPSLLERCNDAYKGDNLPHLLSEKLSSSCEPCFGQQLESLPTISLAFPWTKASSIIATTFVESFSSSTRKKKLRKTQFQLLAETEPDKCRSDARLLCECFDWDGETRPSPPIRCDVWIVERMRYPTDQQTHRPTDITSYRGALSPLKIHQW